MPREIPTLEELGAVLAAIQAAGLAHDYPLAISLLREYELTHLCLGCTKPIQDGFTWKFGDRHELRTCGDCTEDFALWYVSESPMRHMFDAALHGMACRAS